MSPGRRPNHERAPMAMRKPARTTASPIPIATRPAVRLSIPPILARAGRCVRPHYAGPHLVQGRSMQRVESHNLDSVSFGPRRARCPPIHHLHIAVADAVSDLYVELRVCQEGLDELEHPLDHRLFRARCELTRREVDA